MGVVQNIRASQSRRYALLRWMPTKHNGNAKSIVERRLGHHRALSRTAP